MFKGLLLEKNGTFSARISEIDEARLPAADVLVRPEYSCLNYKDGLAITNKGPVVRQWPMVAGIDGAGTVLESSNAEWKPGDRFVLNGWGVGETHWGCLAQKAQLKSEWLIRLPSAFDARQAMAIGTAGYTAMLCVMTLEENGLKAGDGEVLVTGASGGVGSVAIALLSRLGHRVIASTGKADEEAYLKSLGAATVIDRAELSAAGKPMQKERWAGAVDTVGSHTLANVLAQARYGATVAACGLAQGMDLPTSVAPFILRSVTLAGVDSVMAPLTRRHAAWDRLARDLDARLLESITTEVPLSAAIEQAHALMSGKTRGRIVVRVGD